MKFFTFGYTGVKHEQIGAFLNLHSALLVDVRISPRSRHDRWRKHTLEHTFPQRYLHLGAWGNVNYQNYKAIEIKNFDAGLERLWQFNALGWSAFLLMCGCPNYDVCHRKTLADLLVEQGFDIEEVTRQIKEVNP